MAAPMKQAVAPDPGQIGLLGAQGQVPETTHTAQRISKISQGDHFGPVRLISDMQEWGVVAYLPRHNRMIGQNIAKGIGF